MSAPRRIVVALSGASGAIYGIRALEVIRQDRSVELHAIVSSGAKATISYETDRSYEDVVGLADVVHDEKNLAASLASGTFLTAGMLVAPCSMRTMSAIANALNDNLIVRAADVHLKSGASWCSGAETPHRTIWAHARARSRGRRDPAAGAGLLSEADDAHGPRRPQRRKSPRPARHRAHPLQEMDRAARAIVIGSRF